MIFGVIRSQWRLRLLDHEWKALIVYPPIVFIIVIGLSALYEWRLS